LPWTPEYRALEAGIQQRQERRAELVKEALQERRATQVPLWELNELFVEPSYRHQGVGRALVQRLCDEYLNSKRRLSDLYLVTSHPDFFEPLGFECVTQEDKRRRAVPRSLSVNNGQVCMRGATSME
jgi:N-acetylglutamate synthase-like GNAT family acetyltransferase